MSRRLIHLIAMSPLLTIACGDSVSATTAVTDTSTGSTTATTITGTGTSQTGEPTTTAGSVSASQGTSSTTMTTPTTGTSTTEAVTSTTGSTTDTTDATGSTTDTTGTTGSTTDTTGTTGSTTDTTGTTTDTSSTTDTTMGGVCIDNDMDSFGDNCEVGSDCDDNDPYNHTLEGCANCSDADGDGYWTGCDIFKGDKPGPDCDDFDANNHTPEGCENCADADGDGFWVGCDVFKGDKPGPDCDDTDFNNYTPTGCANCKDNDGDGFWVGCDQYDDSQPGPDCNDNNSNVGLGDTTEICNGLSENCAGEIDPLPPDEMCPTQGNPPNVNSWLCQPPQPGQDGCKIGSCVGNWFDVNAAPGDGCECLGTNLGVTASPTCGEQLAGKLGAVSEGDSLNNLPTGTIPFIDNGVGGGNEDWYWVEFPLEGTRPNTGSIRIDFSLNEGNDYRFEVFRNCNGLAWAAGLANQFGAGAPPAREWWFFDNQAPNAKYQDNVVWPSKVYIRVFRVQNDKTCNKYRLRVQRVPN